MEVALNKITTRPSRRHTSSLAAVLTAERTAPPKWWHTPDPEAMQHRRDLAAAVAGWRDPEYRRRMYGEPTTAERTRAIVQDVEWMTRTGETPAGICARLGSRPAALARRLQRAGRPDLARQFQRR